MAAEEGERAPSHCPWEWKRFNLNENVRVRLNERGLRILAAWHASNVARRAEYAPSSAMAMRGPTPEADGAYKFQAWVMMEIFGPHMLMGAEPFSDMNVELWMPETVPAARKESDHG